MLYDFYWPSFWAKVKSWVYKECGIYYPSIAACKRHRQDSCGLEVSGNKIIDEEDISHEQEENSEILVADGDDDHAPIINIYELLMNSEFIEIETDRDDWIIYLLSRYDDHVSVIYAYAKKWPILFT